jgi:glycine C-acetyltransferase
MTKAILSDLKKRLEDLKNEGLFKSERIITSQQQSHIHLQGDQEVLNFCANNYLGLANHKDIMDSAIEGIEEYGVGMASVRFICGTNEVHKTLEKRVSNFLQTEDTILYSSCFDANGGLFETLLGKEDAIISDELNHASIIDGIRLCKAERHRYKNNDMADLEEKLKATQDKRYRLIATDGVFSMDGIIANLKAICDLADKYDALVMVDDCHATGFLGKNGRGSIEYCDVLGRVDIVTSTFGKALGGASGGFTSGRKEIISWLRQRSRPYLFSNTLMPAIATASIEVLNLLEKSDDLREKLIDNTSYFSKKMKSLGFTLAGNGHPIIPVMIGDAALAAKFADKMLEEGIYVVGFSYPVVPMGSARIRTQMSAVHSKEDLDKAISSFEKVGKELGVI